MQPLTVETTHSSNRNNSLEWRLSPGGDTDPIDQLEPWFYDGPRTDPSARGSFDIPPYATGAYNIPVGSYIKFQLDITAFGELLPGGVEAHPWPDHVRNKVGQYVGLVDKVHIEKKEDTVVEELWVKFLAGNRPAVTTAEHHCLLVSPLHPSGDALKTNAFLPWCEDQWQWTVFGVKLRVTQFHDSLLWWNVEDDDLSRFCERHEQDWAELRDAWAALTAEDSNKVNEWMTFGNLSIPAVVWRNIQGADRKNEPEQLIEEVYRINDFLAGLTGEVFGANDGEAVNSGMECE